MMDHLKKRMIKRAKEEHTHIFPTHPHKEFNNDSFTTHDNKLFFWFNTKDQSTKVISEHMGDSQGATGVVCQ